jgi:hypothetical protein
MNDRKRLRRAILDLHGCEARHVRTVPVHEIYAGETIWEGDVEEFGHPKATAAYAWTYEDDDGKLHHVAVLRVAPINSAVNAVQAVAVVESQKGRA